ncbi:MAG: lysostaphin resistance A-like protein [bacterium]
MVTFLLELPAFTQPREGSSALLLLTVLFAYFKVFVTSGVGLHYVRRMHPSGSDAAQGKTDLRMQISELLILQRSGWLLTVSSSVLALVVFSFGLFWLTGATPAESLAVNREGEYAVPLFVLVFVVAAFAFVEEIVFRLGLQNWLGYSWGNSDNAHYAAIAFTAALWALGHAGMMDPDWVKIVQILVMGVWLGWMNRKYGVLACVMTHLVFNVIVVLVEWSRLIY